MRGLKQNIKSTSNESKESHPLWVRGLKHGIQQPKDGDKFVASFTGAWIETKRNGRGNSANRSHPLRVRGLKPGSVRQFIARGGVASFTGAWIETFNRYIAF